MNKNRMFLYFALALVVFSSIALFRQGALWWDETIYLSLADSLYAKHEYSFNNETGENFRAPVLPVLIAASYYIFGPSEISAKLVIFATGLLFAFAAYILGRKLYGDEVGAASALLAVSAPQFVFWFSKILTETVAVLFAALALYVIYQVVEEKRTKLYPLLGALFALAFLTKYPLGLLVPFFFLWVLLQKKHKLLFCRDAIYGAIIFTLILVPWLYNSYTAYGSIFGSMRSNVSIVNDPTRTNAWYEYIVGFLPSFGLTGVIFLAGAAYALLKKDKQGIFLLSWFLLVFLALTFAIVEKQIRYLIIALPSVALLASRFIFHVFEGLRSPFAIPKTAFASVAILAVALTGFIPAFNVAYGNKDVGLIVMDAGLYLHEHAPEGSMIMSQNIPPIHYYSKRNVVWFPKDKSEVINVIIRYNVSYLELDNYNGYPDYALNYFGNNKNFALEYNKTEGDKFIQIYRYNYA